MRSAPFEVIFRDVQKVATQPFHFGHQRKDEQLQLAHVQDASNQCCPRRAAAMAAAADPALALQRFSAPARAANCSAVVLAALSPRSSTSGLKAQSDRGQSCSWLAWDTDPTNTDPDAQAATLKVCPGLKHHEGWQTDLPGSDAPDDQKQQLQMPPPGGRGSTGPRCNMES